MKNAFPKLVMFLLSVSFVFPFCKKDSDSDDSKTPAQHLTAGTWKLTKEELDTTPTQTGVYIDITSELDACALDNILSFSTDGNYTLDEGATKCYPGDPQTETAPYTLSADGKSVMFYDSILMENVTFNILTLNSSNFVIETDLIGSSLKATYSH